MGTAGLMGLQQGGKLAEEQAARRNAFDLVQRQFLYNQWANVAAQPLPEIDPKDPDSQKRYDAALKRRADAIKSQQDVFTPEHHASLGDHIHQLIFGSQQGNQQGTAQGAPQPAAVPATPPVSSNAPQVPGTPPAATPEAAPVAHPFANNPEHNKILGNLEALGKQIGGRMKAFTPMTPKHSLPADFNAFAEAPV